MTTSDSPSLFSRQSGKVHPACFLCGFDYSPSRKLMGPLISLPPSGSDETNMVTFIDSISKIHENSASLAMVTEINQSVSKCKENVQKCPEMLNENLESNSCLSCGTEFSKDVTKSLKDTSGPKFKLADSSENPERKLFHNVLLCNVCYLLVWKMRLLCSHNARNIINNRADVESTPNSGVVEREQASDSPINVKHPVGCKTTKSSKNVSQKHSINPSLKSHVLENPRVIISRNSTVDSSQTSTSSSGGPTEQGELRRSKRIEKLFINPRQSTPAIDSNVIQLSKEHRKNSNTAGNSRTERTNIVRSDSNVKTVEKSNNRKRKRNGGQVKSSAVKNVQNIEPIFHFGNNSSDVSTVIRDLSAKRSLDLSTDNNEGRISYTSPLGKINANSASVEGVGGGCMKLRSNQVAGSLKTVISNERVLGKNVNITKSTHRSVESQTVECENEDRTINKKLRFSNDVSYVSCSGAFQKLGEDTLKDLDAQLSTKYSPIKHSPCSYASSWSPNADNVSVACNSPPLVNCGCCKVVFSMTMDEAIIEIPAALDSQKGSEVHGCFSEPNNSVKTKHKVGKPFSGGLQKHQNIQDETDCVNDNSDSQFSRAPSHSAQLNVGSTGVLEYRQGAKSDEMGSLEATYSQSEADLCTHVPPNASNSREKLLVDAFCQATCSALPESEGMSDDIEHSSEKTKNSFEDHKALEKSTKSSWDLHHSDDSVEDESNQMLKNQTSDENLELTSSQKLQQVDLSMNFSDNNHSSHFTTQRFEHASFSKSFLNGMLKKIDETFKTRLPPFSHSKKLETSTAGSSTSVQTAEHQDELQQPVVHSPGDNSCESRISPSAHPLTCQINSSVTLKTPQDDPGGAISLESSRDVLSENVENNLESQAESPEISNNQTSDDECTKTSSSESLELDTLLNAPSNASVTSFDDVLSLSPPSLSPIAQGESPSPKTLRRRGSPHPFAHSADSSPELSPTYQINTKSPDGLAIVWSDDSE